ncbi:uncharacterized protein BBA_09531 [Beauveria bassiana ARSEF 2860]|uniref:Uncharacterized protein n=1 Tax=Beauveria bassiana (strain ARSEF 2860) TaxID=655819 RepID=J4UFU4_BEAB2|nr:uncharacterized protein BBA_09531 [Beauveria bassiana ARSEF 2860]EJP61507.1 hypothetical protein BBA_09531 [Beauveria bassiana ARSEF 2860]
MSTVTKRNLDALQSELEEHGAVQKCHKTAHQNEDLSLERDAPAVKRTIDVFAAKPVDGQEHQETADQEIPLTPRAQIATPTEPVADNEFEDILSRISFTDLKSCFRVLLSDHVTASTAKLQLQAYNEKAWFTERVRLKEMADRIRTSAKTATTSAERYACTTKALCDLDMWGKAINPCLRPAYDIWKAKAGPQANGPQTAFDLLIDIANMAVFTEWRSGCASVVGDEESNDYTHEDIDKMLVGILQELGQGKDMEHWVKTEENVARLARINELRGRMLGAWDTPLSYRYEYAAQLLSTGKLSSKPEPLDLKYLGHRPILIGLEYRRGGGRKRGGRR